MTLGEGHSLNFFMIRQCHLGKSMKRRKEQHWMENKGLHRQPNAYYGYGGTVLQLKQGINIENCWISVCYYKIIECMLKLQVCTFANNYNYNA